MSFENAPFIWFGGKRKVASEIWRRFGQVAQYVEPFAGSLAVLLANPTPVKLQVVGDTNGFIANFWRAITSDPDQVAKWCDYPVSHVDLGARHAWLMSQQSVLSEGLQDANWPGDHKAAGWWLWGINAWIGSGWCDWGKEYKKRNQIPHVSNAGMGVHALGKIPRVGDASSGMFTPQGEVAKEWLRALAAKLARTTMIHGDWNRCLNTQYGTLGKHVAAVFLDPPYIGFEGLYHDKTPVAKQCEVWCKEQTKPNLRIALCGYVGDYDLPGWDVFEWSRARSTYGSTKTKDKEAIWFSPSCMKGKGQQ